MTAYDEGQAFEKEMNSLLINHAYKRVKRRVFQLNSDSSSIEHFLYLYRGTAAQRRLFNLDFGIREPFADKFSIHCVRKFGILAAKQMKYDETCDCLFKFSVSMLTKKESNVFDIDFGLNQELERFKEIVFNYASKELVHADNLDKFYKILISHDEDEWYTWAFSDGAVRTALAVALGKLAGHNDDMLKAQLQPYHIRIRSSCVQELTPEEYVDVVFGEWEKFQTFSPRDGARNL